MKDRCNECRYKMERHGIVDGEDVYYCDICGIYQSYPLEEEALLAAEKGDFFKPLTQSEIVTISCDKCKHEEDYSTKDLVSFNEKGFPTCSNCYPKFNQGVDKPNSYSIIREHSAAEKKNCGCGKDPCVTYGAESEKKPEKDHNCIACGHHSAHITMGDDKFCYDCYHYAETYAADFIECKDESCDTGHCPTCGNCWDGIEVSCSKCGDDWGEYSKLLDRELYGAETFNSYKVAPELSSYTVDELVDSIAGPQGSAAYDEMVYDPIAQDRQSAESFSLPKTLLLLGSIAAGLGFGIFLTRKLEGLNPETSDEGGA